MKTKSFALALMLFITTESFCQIIFEKGYFINESDQKTDCLIKNKDWNSNPIDFSYKLTQDDSVKNAVLQSVKEFGFEGGTKYVRANVLIDYSSDQVNKMSKVKNPEFIEKLLFLKVLVEGEASLFEYIEGNLTRYFYKMSDSEVKQLVYKQYLIGDQYGHNNTFRQQLYNDLKCDNLKEADFVTINYYEKELKRLFLQFNSCHNPEYINYKSDVKRDLFNVSLRPGLSISKLSIDSHEAFLKDTDFDTEIGFRFGTEFELVLPFNNSKWSFIIEPTYQYYKTSAQSNSSGYSPISGYLQGYNATVNYQSIEVPIGVRHYFFLNDDFKLFTNISYVFDFPFNSSIKFTKNPDNSDSGELEISTTPNLSLGIGLKYKGKFGMEILWHKNREILNEYRGWNSAYSSTSVVFGYTLF